jgi:hypothetical protein
MYLYIRLKIWSKKTFINWVSVQNSPEQNILLCLALCLVLVALQGKKENFALQGRAGQDPRAIRFPCPDDDLWFENCIFSPVLVNQNFIDSSLL